MMSVRITHGAAPRVVQFVPRFHNVVGSHHTCARQLSVCASVEGSKEETTYKTQDVKSTIAGIDALLGIQEEVKIEVWSTMERVASRKLRLHF